MFPHQQRVVDERRERGPLSTQWTTRPPDRRLLGKQEAGKHLPVCSPINLTPPLLPRGNANTNTQIHKNTNKKQGGGQHQPDSTLTSLEHQRSFFTYSFNMSAKIFLNTSTYF